MRENDLQGASITMGGFSAGGNVALLLADHLVAAGSPVAPEKAFLIDSPIDILALYRTSQKNVELDVSEASVRESEMVIDLLDRQVGGQGAPVSAFESLGVYTDSTQYTGNVAQLRDVDLRLYTEEAEDWWREHRGVEPASTNAYAIKQFAQALAAESYTRAEYVGTHDRGFRANGERHPHAWSIVDVAELLVWMRAK